jgi:uncharacterized protein YbcI
MHTVVPVQDPGLLPSYHANSPLPITNRMPTLEGVAEQQEQLEGGQLLVALSSAMVGLFRDFLGKGPERCKSYFAGNDLVVILLGGGYTVAEQTLYDAGQGQAVQNSRHALQTTLAARMGAIVEELTGRRVVAFMSASHQHPDLSAELFVLEPEDPDHPASPSTG